MEKIEITICYGRKCIKNGAKYIIERIFNEFKKNKEEFEKLDFGESFELQKNITIKKDNCNAECSDFPRVYINGELLENATSISVWNSIAKKIQQNN